MEAFLEIIAVVFLGLLFVLAVSVNLLWVFSKEKSRKIHIVHKRETISRNLRSYYGGQNNKYSSHYTVDCKYPGSDKIHTLDCSFDIYNNLKEGKTYIVNTKVLSITSIVKKGVPRKENFL